MTLFDLPAASGPIGQLSPAAPSGPLVRVRAVVAYDGSGFHGFAVQPGRPTVAGVLSGALEKALRRPVELTCAGRTDAGVHGWGQVVSFDAPADRFDPVRLRRSVNRQCGPAVVVRSLEQAPDEFDARFSAASRLYRYTILNAPTPEPFLASTAWHVERPLDLPALRLACDPLIGEHDFASFCRRPKPSDPALDPVSLVRRVLDARWEVVTDEPAVDGRGRRRLLHFWIEANAFCHQMVRSVVGTVVDVGFGKRRAGEVAGIVRAADRAAAGPLAPPQGLCLWHVRY